MVDIRGRFEGGAFVAPLLDIRGAFGGGGRRGLVHLWVPFRIKITLDPKKLENLLILYALMREKNRLSADTFWDQNHT